MLVFLVFFSDRNDHFCASDCVHRRPQGDSYIFRGELSVGDHGHRPAHRPQHRLDSSHGALAITAIIQSSTTCCPCLSDEPRSGDNYPSQTEMALIYQSAAWILAGLLLAIIVFLIVAILINKKKKWVQMSCYSAPKKVRRSPRIASICRRDASDLSSELFVPTLSQLRN